MSAAPTRPIRFGALLRQADNRWSSIAAAARIADDLGFDAIHFIEGQPPEEPHGDPPRARRGARLP